MASLPFALVVAQPPDEDLPLPVVLVLATLHPDFAARHGGEIIRAERGQLAAGVHDRILPTAPVPAIAHEAAPVDRADERLGDVDRSALTARERRERGQSRGLGHPRGP